MYLKFSYYIRNLLILYLSSKLQVENLISLFWYSYFVSYWGNLTEIFFLPES